MMFSLSANIPLFFLGPMAKSLGLNIVQAGVGAFLGNLFAVILAWLIGVAGVKYGITYPVQLRESFGLKGAHVPLVLRGIYGTVWFGIEIYAGSLALMIILLMALGVPSEELVATAIRWIPIACALYVLSFILVMRHGLKGIGAVADWAGPILRFCIYLARPYFWRRGRVFAQNPGDLESSAATLAPVLPYT